MKHPVVLLCAFALTVGPVCAADPPGSGVRSPAVAGSFYPGDRAKLEAAIEAYLNDSLPSSAARPAALIVPHAGYIFSGQIAADAYRQAMGHDYDLVVILGTNHTVAGFSGVSVDSGTGYRTPLGVAEIDEAVVAALLRADPVFNSSAEVHEREHSVEVQVPFVQVAFPGVRIVAAVVGRPDPGLCDRVGSALAKVLKGRRPLIVASTDLSHYPAYEDAVATDLATLAAMAEGDSAALHRVLVRQLRAGRAGLSTCACGEAPAMVAMAASRQMGFTSGAVISYANSGDTAVGDRSRVVGYGAVAFFDTKGQARSAPLWRPLARSHLTPLTVQEKRTLLAFARESIHRYLTTGTAPLARCPAPALWRHQGVFVTLRKGGRLRGCIGHQLADMPVCQVVGATALRSAFNDRRFQPLRLTELPEIDIEISLLTPPRRVEGADAVVVGRDGVLMVKDGKGAVFLPQVAVEQGWSREQMLERLCLKAGLPAGSWREGAELYTFQAVVFSESSHGSS